MLSHFTSVLVVTVVTSKQTKNWKQTNKKSLNIYLNIYLLKITD